MRSMVEGLARSPLVRRPSTSLRLVPLPSKLGRI